MLKLKESIDDKKLVALKESAKSVIYHHDALRMSYRQEDGEVVQVNRDKAELHFQEVDLTEAEHPVKKLGEIANATQNSFNLAEDTLIRFVLFHLKDGYRLLIVAHHLVIDGVSWRILVEDLELGYRQACENRPINLPLKTTSFKEWSQKLADYGLSPEFEKESMFWNELESRKKAILPESGFTQLKEKAISTIHLDEETTNTLLSKTNQAFNTGINDILLTALSQAIARWSGETIISIDLESHGRSERFDRIDLSRTVGWFTSVYPIVLDITGCENLKDRIIAVKEQLREIPDNGIGYGITQYLMNKNDHLKPREGSEILFNYLGQFDRDMDTELFGIASEHTGKSVDPMISSSHKLAFNGMIALGRFSMTLGSDVYSKKTLDSIQTLFKESLIDLISYCETRTRMFYPPTDFTHWSYTKNRAPETRANG
jgi:non-ribosomal peptide synthase protein (TIGR01720 family)